MRFLADENFPLASVNILRQAGYDTAAIIQDSPGLKDAEVLGRAVQEQRILLSFDRCYGELIYRWKKPAPIGIVYFRFIPRTPEEPGELLLRLLKQSAISLEGKLTILEHGRVRQRPIYKTLHGE
ncbi:MAG: DUF5615 family PIN-like protein [Thermoguttaceae bacterium]|nr:DUF5615 family PIN-like protein [Thermoguttaceae bacterium]MDW8038787.1 DUF5615 family PIN-like protein [Thermoguttaceae bacterium]